MENISINFTSQINDGVSKQVYNVDTKGQLIKDESISKLSFYIEDDYYIVFIKKNEINIFKRGKDNIDMSFDKYTYKLKYYINENFIIEGNMKEFYYDDNSIKLEYYLDDKYQLINQIKIEFKE